MTTNSMTSRSRLETVFRGEKADRTPTLGGWLPWPWHLCQLTGASIEEYEADPSGTAIRAYQRLDVDGLIAMLLPRDPSDYRGSGRETYVHARLDMPIEDALARIDAMPDAAQILAGFDFAAAYTTYRSQLVGMQARCGDVVWMPGNWEAGAIFEWYFDFGYETFFEIVGAHEKQARKLFEVGGARGYWQSRLVARAVAEGLLPHAVLLGEDICCQRGPMVSPRFLERYYAPQLRQGLQPLLDAGCRPVWHCDGDVRPLLDMLIDCGVQGFQGFQPDCGVTVEDVIKRRTRDGRPLLIFGPLSVTTELPVLAAEQVRQRVRDVIAMCRDQADLVLFTSSSILPDVPLANVIAMYEAAREG
jgi:hypothetical protein